MEAKLFQRIRKCCTASRCWWWTITQPNMKLSKRYCHAPSWFGRYSGISGAGYSMKYDGLEVLLVEDNPDDLQLTLQTLKEAHLTNPIQVVRDGVEVLDYIFCRGTHAGRKADGPSLFLLDLKLPKIDGLQVLRAIKADPRTKGIPVVILTSFARN